MRFRPAHMNTHEMHVFNRTESFLRKGLENRDVLNWAIDLKSTNIGEREAIKFLFDHLNDETNHIKEPWLSAWGFLVESFHSELNRANQQNDFDHIVAQKISKSDKSSTLVSEVCNHVAPWIKIQKAGSIYGINDLSKKKPKKLSDLIYVSMDSPSFPSKLNTAIENNDDRQFIQSLVTHLNETIHAGFNLGRRIGWDEKVSWRLGLLKRVYYIPIEDNSGNSRDPDEHHSGIAPAIKLFYSALLRLHILSKDRAKVLIDEQRNSQIDIQRRLWAALARSESIADGREVFQFINNLSRSEFWQAVNLQPEYVELYTLRFTDFSTKEQNMLIDRIKKGPPKSIWRNRKLSDEEFDEIKNYRITQEFKRLQLGSTSIPKIVTSWLDDNMKYFPDLLEMDTISFDFPKGVSVSWRPSEPDQSFNDIHGQKRLEELERSFDISHPDDRKVTKVHDWLNETGNMDKVLGDFEIDQIDVNNFPLVLDQLAKQLRKSDEPTRDKDLARRFFNIATSLESETYSKAYEGLSDWLVCWLSYVQNDKRFTPFWLSLWNASIFEYSSKKKLNSNTDVNTESSNEHWMITSATWDLTCVFVELCPSLNDEPKPFGSGALKIMRDSLDAVKGEPREISDYILMRSISYFYIADEKWTKERLIFVLEKNAKQSAWEALSRSQFLSPEVLSVIGIKLVEKSTDSNLSRKIRKSFAARLLNDVIHAYRKQLDSSISAALVTRMLRNVDDEVRVHAAMQLSRFARYWTGKDLHQKFDEDMVWSPENFWSKVIISIIDDVWPKDVHLITPSISDAFADLPVLAGECFSEAVEKIDRYLLPFDCWALHDYGFDFQHNDKLKDVINNTMKAASLLHLLDKTVGTNEEAVIPYDLSTALSHIQIRDKKLATLPSFKRLSAQAR